MEDAAKSNAKAIENEIDKLKNGHWNFFRRQYNEFWSHSKEITEMFRTLKPLAPSDRERLWEKVSLIREEAKRNQTREREARLADSKIKRDLVNSKIKDAYHYAKGASNSSDLSKAKSLLNEALEWMKDGWGGFNAMTQIVSHTEGKLTKEDRDICWQNWKEANETIRERRQHLGDLNYNVFRNKAYSALTTAESGDPHDAKIKVKEVQGEMKGTQMAKFQFQDIHEILDRAWQKANSRLQEAYHIKQAKHEEWVTRTQEHIERWSALIDKNESVIAGIENQIDRCQEMESSARSSDFADTVRGWIEEKYQKIEDIRRTNRELDEKIRSARSKLRG